MRFILRTVSVRLRKIGATLPRVAALGFVLAALISAPLAHSQAAPPQSAPVDLDPWGRPVPPPARNHKSAPAPRHDISGTWDPVNGQLDGVQFNGSKAFQEDGKSDREPPYTALGRQEWQRNKPSIGSRGVVPAEANDPVLACDPQGFPRENLFQLRTTQIVQTPVSVAILYEFDQIWRVIWTDGRELPRDPEPRWFGYSVGKWVDDYTLVVTTIGTDERTWLDRAGRPHSADLRVEERFHRTDRDHLELTVTIDDPKMYTKPWVALDKFVFDMQPSSFDVREMIWSPSEYEQYNKLMGNSAGGKDSH
jgi:hypothetical protein